MGEVSIERIKGDDSGSTSRRGEFDFLRSLGVPIYENDGIHDDVCWVADQGVALIRPDLSPERRAAACDWLLAVAVYWVSPTS